MFEIVSDTENFDVAIQALDNAYIKPTNIVYNRHQLITCKQEPMQSIDTYMQQLERIAKSCNFQAVTAEENKQQYIRDAFINGINSPFIRQRLLERSTLSLEDTYRQARTLEQAQKQSAPYDNGIVARIDKEDITDQQQLIAALAPKKKIKIVILTKTTKNSNKIVTSVVIIDVHVLTALHVKPNVENVKRNDTGQKCVYHKFQLELPIQIHRFLILHD